MSTTPTARGLDELERIALEEGVTDDDQAEAAFAGRTDVDELAGSAEPPPPPPAPPRSAEPAPSLTPGPTEPVDAAGRTAAERLALESAAAASGRDPNAPVNTKGQTLEEADAEAQAARARAAAEGRDLAESVDVNGKTALERARESKS